MPLLVVSRSLPYRSYAASCVLQKPAGRRGPEMMLEMTCRYNRFRDPVVSTS